ncbi:MAG: efflux transporter periplasmic adaptor subunit, partial [Gammaproteobacteria bacterium]|nr:efflux transporter periplasmic adaptor subunit [Gammaproteobacteria bacterium]
MNKQTLMVAILVALAVGGGGGYWLASFTALDAMNTVGDAEQARKPLFYRNPMNPAITSPVPAQDEMGMDYIPVYADGDNAGDAPAGTVRIDPVTVQNIGVRTAIAEQRTLSRHIRAVGRVAYNEERL